MLLRNKVYDVLKWLCIIGIPAASVLYVAVASIWELQYTTEITGTLDAAAVFIGALIGISTREYKKDNTTDRESSNES